MRLIDLTGMRFGMLTVLSRAVSTPRKPFWHCLCDCGASCRVSGDSLRSAHTKSCGCAKRALSRSKRSNPAAAAGLSPAMWVQYCKHKHLGTRTGRGFLPISVWARLVSSPCAYCGDAQSHCYQYVSSVDGTPTRLRTEPMQGIDRVDSSKGYAEENCVACCWMCNKMKLDLPVDEFRAHIKKIASFLG